MKGWKASDIPQEDVDRLPESVRKDFELRTSAEIEASRANNDDKAEKVIQREVEAYLIQLGYWPRTKADIMRGIPKSGWWIHLNQTKRNPILCDLLILGKNGRYLELELKTTTGRLTEEQEILCSGNCWIARSSEEAAAFIFRWHNKS